MKCKMKVLYHSNSRLYGLLHDEDTDEYFLDVLCGGVFMYSVALKLHGWEAAYFQSRVEQGDTAELDALATRVWSHSRKNFAGREMLFSDPDPWLKIF